MAARISFFVVLCLMAVGSGQVLAAPTEPSVFWETMIRRGSFSEIATAFASPATPKWPHSDKVSANDDKVRQLAKLLHEKLRAEMSPQAELSSDSVRAFAVIAGALHSAGGYTNLLLADSFSRVALYQTSKWAVEGSRELSEVKDLAATIPSYPVILPDLLRSLASRDKTIQMRLDAFDATAPSATLFAAAEKLGPEAQSSLARGLSAEGQKFTVLFANPSAMGLAVRLAGTELFQRVSLRALITFLERGETREELNPADITAFKHRMQGTMKSFAYPPLGLKSLSVENPLSLFELHSDAAKQKLFLQIALD